MWWFSGARRYFRYLLHCSSDLLCCNGGMFASASKVGIGVDLIAPSAILIAAR